MTVNVSYIGLGSMGIPMVRNLLRNGVNVAVWNRSKDKALVVVNEGAKLLNSPQDAFDHGEIVFSTVANDEAFRAITEAPGGLLENAKPGCIHVSMSTLSPAIIEEFAAKHKAKGMELLSTPVFGRPEGATAATLTIAIAGEHRAKQKVEPLLRFLSKKLHDFGEQPHIANVVKITGNFMILSTVEALAEAYAFAEKNNVPMEALNSLFSESLFPTPSMKTYGRILLERHFTPAGFKLSLGLKDINLFLRQAELVKTPTPIAGILHDRLMAGMASDRGDFDWSAIAITVLEESGLSHAQV